MLSKYIRIGLTGVFESIVIVMPYLECINFSLSWPKSISALLVADAQQKSLQLAQIDSVGN